MIPRALEASYGGRPQEAYARCGEVLGIAERFGDPGLLAMSRLVCGHALVLMGEAEQGLSLLDEVLLAVTTGDLSPVFTGIAYCVAIIACCRVLDLHGPRSGRWR